MESNEFQTCLLCQSTNILGLKDYEKNFLVKCSDCSFVFSKKKPAFEELFAHYSLYPRLNSISPVTIRRYNKLLDKMDRFRRNNNLIDVGCGDGYFLEEAKKRGWNVYGTEVTDDAIEVCERKGIKMYKGTLQASRFNRNYFDVVTCFEVIEHINNPIQELTSFYEILRDGGMVYITTPNFNSISRSISGSKWNVIEYPEHLCYYTKKTLEKLFFDTDFRLLKLATTGVSMDRLRRSANAASAHSLRSYDEYLRKKLEYNLFLKYAKVIINFLLNLFNKGDSLKAFFVKQ